MIIRYNKKDDVLIIINVVLTIRIIDIIIIYNRCNRLFFKNTNIFYDYYNIII